MVDSNDLLKSDQLNPTWDQSDGGEAAQIKVLPILDGMLVARCLLI